MNKSATLITGASSDLGMALIRHLLPSSAGKILAHYHSNGDGVKELAAAHSDRIVPLQADLSTESGCQDFINQIHSTELILDKVVHLVADKIQFKHFKSIEWSQFQRDWELQVRSAVEILHAFLPGMGKAKSGKVVVVLSSCTFGVPPAALSSYVTVKYALLGLVKALASEYASKGVSINAVSPSMVDTKFTQNVPSAMVEMLADAHPRKRHASVGEVVPAIGFLLSDQAGFVTGANLPIAGGQIF